ncbi:MAG: SDR family NAD(P)-dependent oxidoreductase [Chitinivibrionales bacterium]|nr:SDR family NAD(P)-dependent oxidoreductase [Chitinivibrionales bacterium]
MRTTIPIGGRSRRSSDPTNGSRLFGMRAMQRLKRSRVNAGATWTGAALSSAAIHRWSAMLLEGRNVFLTGGSRGIGRHAVIELVRYGANVAFTYVRNEEAAAETKKLANEVRPEADVRFYQLNVTDSKQVEQVAAKAISDFESINVVVNNAGNLNDALVANMTDEQWFDVINTHLTGTFYVCREFINEFLFNKGGKFINTSSITYTGSAGQANYSAAKAGVIGFSRALAKEWGKKGIYTNVVVPGYYDT